MFLTRQRRTTPPDYNKFPTGQLFVLALVRVAEPIALTSIFPYAWKLVLNFHVGDPSNASFYAGILIAAFSLAESLTGMYWGGLSDQIGRKPVLLMGCAGTILSLLIVGFSTNFWIALLGRAIGGFLNGNIGVVQTMVGEITVNPKHEPRAYAIMPFVWSIGTILGPSIGGYFAEPAKSHADLFSKHGVFAKFPYLLPNLICACLMIVSIVAGYICLDETHPDMLPWNDPHPEHAEHAEAETPLFATQAGMTTSGVDLRNVESYGTFNAVDSETDELWRVKSNGQPESDTLSSDERPKALTRRVVMLVVALGIFTYHSMTYDHLLPIFFQDAKVGDMTITSAGTLAGGLGLSIQQVGLIMSINGVIALAVQAIVFPLAAAWLGVWKVFILVTVLHPIAYIVVPFLAMLPDEFVFPGIYTCLTIRNLLSILAYPVLLILIKEASPNPSSLGKLNGLAASTGAACRTIASPVAGLLYGISIRVNFTALAWWASALVAVIGAIQAFFIHQRKDGETHRVRARFMSDAGIKQDIVHIRVQDAEEEQRLLAPEA